MRRGRAGPPIAAEGPGIYLCTVPATSTVTEAPMLVRGCLAGLLLSLVLTPVGMAQEPAATKKIVAADAAGMAAYKSGDAQRAKETLLEAIVLGKENGLEAHPVMATVYLHLG